MKKLLQGLIIAVVIMSVCLIPIVAHAESPSITARVFYGTVTINGNPAPAGTVIEAQGDGVRTGLQDNPLVTTEVGYYGRPAPRASGLIVQGDITAGTLISFYVNGVAVDNTHSWPSDSVEPHVSEFNLAVTIPVNRLVTQTVLTSSANPSQSQHSVTFTAVVSSAVSSPNTPSGSVLFYKDGVTLSTSALSQGKAEYTVSSLNTGNYIIKAVYSGDQNFLSSEASLTQTVEAVSSGGGGGGGTWPPATVMTPTTTPTPTAPVSTTPVQSPSASTPPPSSSPAVTVPPTTTVKPAVSPAASTTPAASSPLITTPAPTSPTVPSDSGTSHTGLIIGIVVGCAVIVTAVVVLIRRNMK
jgi:hypothetical protein